MTKFDNKGLNLALDANMLSDEDMRAYGFTDHTGENWYYSTMVTGTVSFNVLIPKDGSRFSLDILDEEFLQPYDYQYFLKRDPKHEFALYVQAKVETELQKLSDKGILTGWAPGIYV